MIEQDGKTRDECLQPVVGAMGSSAGPDQQTGAAAVTEAEQGHMSKLQTQLSPGPLAEVSAEAPYRKVLYIMRGPPGCGKSTAARHLLKQHLEIQGVQWSGAVFCPLVRAF